MMGFVIVWNIECISRIYENERKGDKSEIQIRRFPPTFFLSFCRLTNSIHYIHSIHLFLFHDKWIFSFLNCCPSRFLLFSHTQYTYTIFKTSYYIVSYFILHLKKKNIFCWMKLNWILLKQKFKKNIFKDDFTQTDLLTCVSSCFLWWWWWSVDWMFCMFSFLETLKNISCKIMKKVLNSFLQLKFDILRIFFFRSHIDRCSVNNIFACNNKKRHVIIKSFVYIIYTCMMHGYFIPKKFISVLF